MSDADPDRILAALQASGGALSRELAGLAVDHLLAQRLRDVVDLDAVATLVLSAFTSKNVGGIVTRHVQPGVRRYLTEVAKSKERVSDLVPPGSRAAIHAIAKNWRVARPEWAAGLVDPVLVRKLLGPVWMKVLLSFGARLPVPGAGAAAAVSSAVGKGVGGIAGRLSRSAEKLADAGRSVMGGLGAEVERRMQGAAKDFSDGAAELFRDALQERLRSEEGKAILEELVSKGVDHVLRTRLADIHEDVRRVPLDAIFAATPDILAHAASGEFVGRIVRAEVSAFLATEGERTVSEVLTELSVRDEARARLVASAEPIMGSFVSSAPFADFLGRLLGA
ncbi:MAG TPA: hypothetical protein VHE30_10925 [Polyangiaceae bacterium]|nr:hypothetical protein [Polyangiaceae bacterium]